MANSELQNRLAELNANKGTITENMQPFQDRPVPLFNGEDQELVTGLDYYLHSGDYPLFLEKLDELDIEEEQRQDLFSAYFGVKSRKLSECLDREFEIVGSIIFSHPPFKGPDGFTHPGYNTIYMHTSKKDEDGNDIVLRTSSVTVCMVILRAMKKYGWWQWMNGAKPYTMKLKFTSNGTGNYIGVKTVRDQKN